MPARGLRLTVNKFFTTLPGVQLRTISSILLAVLVILLCAERAAAEPKPQKRRPRIGLILEGGGARGFSHVGVLKILEKNRVPIDFIAGTSMGSIVAGAYAAGRSPAEMEKVLSSTDWAELFDESVPRSEIPFRLKSGREREIFGDAKLSLQGGGLILPSGFIQGQRILPLLQNLFRDVPNPADFDKLAVPLRVVAADIETGKAHVFRDGDLSRAVRASMSVPGAFSAVELDGHLLVDGGIANNLPVDQGLEAGMDVLIVVEIQELFANREELKSPFAVTGQMLGFLLEENTQRSLKLLRPQDIRIGVDLRGYGSGDFAKGAEIMEKGRAEAEAMESQLQHLALSEAEYEEYQRRRHNQPAGQPIEFIRIENDSVVPNEAIQQQFGIKVGDSLDRAIVDEAIERIYRGGSFASVDYDYRTENGQNGIVVTVRDKPWYKEYARIGLTVEDDFDGNTIFGLALDYRLNRLNKWGGYWAMEGQVGTNPNIY